MGIQLLYYEVFKELMKFLIIYILQTEFRFYWLHSKIEECPEVKFISKDNPVSILI